MTTTKENIINKIINIFKNDPDLFNDCVEQLDACNGYLKDKRFYPMDQLNNILCDKKPAEIMRMMFNGCNADEYTTGINGEQYFCEFDPNADFFRFNGCGNLVSTNYIDYSDCIDKYVIYSMMENRQHIDSINYYEWLAVLFDQLEEAQKNDKQRND